MTTKDVKYPYALVSNDIDNPTIAYTDNVKDTPLDLMQRAINDVLSRYFGFKSGSVSIDGNNLANGSIDLGKLGNDVTNYFQSYFTNKIKEMNLDSISDSYFDNVDVLSDLLSRVSYLEAQVGSNGTGLQATKYDGFFVTDESGNIGACVLPDGSAYGWGGNAPSETLVFGESYGGSYVVVKGANFSQSGLGSITESTPAKYILLGSIVYDNNNPNRFTITAAPSDNSYSGGYSWFVIKGNQYVTPSSQSTNGNTATFDITATGGPVMIACQSLIGSATTSDFNVVYTASEEPAENIDATNVNIEFVQNFPSGTGSSSQSPVEGTTFSLRAVPDPSNANIKSYSWNINQSNVPSNCHVIPDSIISKTCKLAIPQTAAMPYYIVVECTATNMDDDTVTSAPMTIWFKYVQPSDDFGVTGLRIYNDGVGFDAKGQQQLAVELEPAGAEATVTWEVASEDIIVSNNGLVSLTDSAVAGSKVVVSASTPNLKFDSTIPESETNQSEFRDATILDVPSVLPLQKIRISTGNKEFYGGTLYMDIIPTPYREEYKNVTWRITCTNDPQAPSKFSIDKYGTLTISETANDKVYDVVVTAISKVDRNIKDAVQLKLKYVSAQPGREIGYIDQVCAVGGEYVDFYAYGHYGTSGVPAYYLNNNDVTWEVSYISDIQSSTEATNDINTAIQQSQGTSAALSPRTSVSSILPINGMQEATLVDVSQGMNYYSASDVQALIHPGDAPVTPTKGGLLKSRSLVPKFGEGEDEDHPTHRLFLANVSGKQGVTIKCTYLDDYTNSYRTDSHYYEFEYQEGKLPVDAIQLTKIDYTGGAKNGISILFDLQKYVQPVCASGKTVDDYLFNPANVGFAHLTGEIENNYCKLPEEGKGMMIKDAVKDASGGSVNDTWVLSYSLEGERTFWLQRYLAAYNNLNTSYSYTPYPKITTGTPYPQDPHTTVVLRHNGGMKAAVSSVTIVYDLEYDFYDANNPANSASTEFVITGFKVSAKDQNNQVISDVVWAVTGGDTYSANRYYCHVDIYGNIRLRGTGGEWKNVVLSCQAGDVSATPVTFRVRR